MGKGQGSRETKAIKLVSQEGGQYPMGPPSLSLDSRRTSQSLVYLTICLSVWDLISPVSGSAAVNFRYDWGKGMSVCVCVCMCGCSTFYIVLKN